MKTYEGLFILNLAGKEENLKDVIDRVSSEITAAGGAVQTVQKMDKRPFARVANLKVSSGFYVNFIFDAEPDTLGKLKQRFALDEEVFRVLYTLAPKNQLNLEPETAPAD